MRKIIAYNPNNGHIISFMRICTDEVLVDTDSVKYIETDLESVTGCYIADGQVVPLQLLNIVVDKKTVSANGIDEVTISNIPIGATVLIPRIGRVVAESDSITLTFTETGIHPLIFMAQTYHTKEVIINAI